MRLILQRLIVVAVTIHFSTAMADELTAPPWLFPLDPPVSKPRVAYDDVVKLSIPGSDVAYTQARINNPYFAPDWHPLDHSPMPDIVAFGRAPDVMACAYCHTPTGQGRPENSPLAGLSAEYIEEQLLNLRSGARRPVGPESYLPMQAMHRLSVYLSNTEIKAAAEYFSRQKLAPRVEVIERARIPRVMQAAWTYKTTEEGGEEDLGQRIIEIAPDFTRHERRDDRMRYIAYVPPGSVEKGKVLVNTGGAGITQSCAGCHDVDLRGTSIGPPIAGRSPSYVLRQLVAFRQNTRTTARAQMMQPVVEKLTLDEMLAMAAYIASLPP
ncbi:MAG TPA: c-type cytochrome [Povalibacter sp.]